MADPVSARHLRAHVSGELVRVDEHDRLPRVTGEPGSSTRPVEAGVVPLAPTVLLGPRSPAHTSTGRCSSPPLANRVFQAVSYEGIHLAQEVACGWEVHGAAARILVELGSRTRWP